MPRRSRDDANEGFELDDMEGFDSLDQMDETEPFDPDADLDEVAEIDFEDPNYRRSGWSMANEDLDDLD